MSYSKYFSHLLYCDNVFSDSDNITLHIHDDIAPVMVEALLQCIYHGKAMIKSFTDDVVRFHKICSELGIEVKHLEDTEWTLELLMNAEHLHKFLLSGELSDVSFVVEGEKLSVHRAILCCHSEVLLAMLSGAFAEGHQKEVESASYLSLLKYSTGDNTELSLGIILLSAGVALYWSV